MSEAPASEARANLIGGIVSLLAGVAILVAATGYSGTAGFFPRLVALFAIAVCIIDIVLSWRAYRRAGIQAADLSPFAKTLEPHLGPVFWLVVFVLAIWLLGFHVGIVVMTATFIWAKGKISPREGVFFAVVLAAVLYVVFEIGLSVRIYSGVFTGTLRSLF